MQGRTFFRIMIDSIFINNAFSRAIINLVNFCNEFNHFSHKKLKFAQKKPLNNITNDNYYKNKFIFNKTENYGVDYK